MDNSIVNNMGVGDAPNSGPSPNPNIPWWRGVPDALGLPFSANWERNYNQQMDNTKYQRMVADMKKAGLNPVLGAGSGGSASAPSTSYSGNSGRSHKVDKLGKLVSSAYMLSKLFSVL